MSLPRLSWDIGTAYDLFISLDVLHEPSTYGVRGVWAAGMRSRLPAAEREFLEEVIGLVIGVPLGWVYSLPAPKDGAVALHTLAHIAPAERLPRLTCDHPELTEPQRILMGVAQAGAWQEPDLGALREAIQREEVARRKAFRRRLSRKDLTTLLDWWTRPVEFGERYLKALQAYYEVFFAEEERRIYPALQAALARGQEMAASLPVDELVVELSEGLSLANVPALDELILGPSYWGAPLVYFHSFGPDRMLMLFGARPAEASLIPGEVVPEALLRALKALSDPTRLKIVHYLAAESLTPTQLSHRLRLRAPTVVHHLQTLRVAGLVYVTIAEGKERSYALRTSSVIATCEALQHFLGIDQSAGPHTPQ